MRVIVTCGPSYEPIDRVRRLTNFSTGELGLILAARLAASGHELLCFKGEGATAQVPTPGVEIRPFSTNDDLLGQMRALEGRAGAIFHAAALCDFRVGEIEDTHGQSLRGPAKLSTRAGGLTLTLVPTTKVLPQLRAHFPAARIVGWKYELDGTRKDVLARAQRQFAEAATDACVVNGRAWGEGFGLVEPGQEPVEVPDKPALCALLLRWLESGGGRLDP